MTRVLLLHPPLLGPGTWAPVARRLSAGGHAVAVPDLRPAVEHAAGWWSRALEVCGPADLVVAHSGAGVLLPLAVVHGGARTAVFADAIVPAVQGETTAGTRISEFVERLPHDDGRLPPWSSWWEPGLIEQLVPDADQLAALRAEEPQLPADFYDVAVPVPAEWEPAAVGYVRLSAAYDEAADEAELRGWQVHRLDGTHLDPLTRPDSVIDALDSLGAIP